MNKRGETVPRAAPVPSVGRSAAKRRREETMRGRGTERACPASTAGRSGKETILPSLIQELKRCSKKIAVYEGVEGRQEASDENFGSTSPIPATIAPPC